MELHIGNCYDKNGNVIDKNELDFPQLAELLTQIIRIRTSNANVVPTTEFKPVA